MNDERRWALALVTVGVAARLAAAFWLGGSLHFVDEAIYLDAARRLLGGEGFETSYANVPGYPVVLAMLAAPWPDHVVLIRAAQAVLAGLGVVPLLRLGRRFFGTRTARVAGVFYALDPLMVVSGALLYAEAVATVVLLVALLTAWRATQGRVRWSLVVGMLLGVLALLRPVALVLVPVVGVWVAACTSRRSMSHLVAVALGCILALAPWTVRNYHVHGRLVPISTTGTQGARVDRDEVVHTGLTASILHRMWDDPVDTAQRLGREFVHFWEPYPTRLWTDSDERRAVLHEADARLPTEATFPSGLRDQVSALSFGLEMFLALVGLPLAWRRNRAATVLLLGVSVAYGLGYALFTAKLRYRIPVLPCVFLLAGVTLAASWNLARRRAR